MQLKANAKSLAKSTPSVANIPPADPLFSLRLRRIAKLLDLEAEQAQNGRVSEFFRTQSEHLKEIARIGAQS